MFEDGGQRRDFVHVEDVAARVRDVPGRHGDLPPGHLPYNVGSGVVSTVGDLARALSASRGGPDPVVTGEYRLGDVRHITASSELLRRELGWRARVSLREGVCGLQLA